MAVLSGADARRREAHRKSSHVVTSVREFLKQPWLVGSAFPASHYLADALLAPFDWTGIRLVVEYGPGSGPLTRAILSKMPRSGRLLAIDVSAGFTEHLRRTIPDPRLTAVTGSAVLAEEIIARHGLGRADLIVTGIPFSTMDAADGERIAGMSSRILRPSGVLAAYQMRSTIAPLLKRHFASVAKSYVWRNIPPCHLYWASGGEGGQSPLPGSSRCGETVRPGTEA